MEQPTTGIKSITENKNKVKELLLKLGETKQMAIKFTEDCTPQSEIENCTARRIERTIEMLDTEILCLATCYRMISCDEAEKKKEKDEKKEKEKTDDTCEGVNEKAECNECE